MGQLTAEELWVQSSDGVSTTSIPTPNPSPKREEDPKRRAGLHQKGGGLLHIPKKDFGF